MDIRDKSFLQATRKVQQQNRWLWGGVMIMLAGFLALGIFEAALFAGRQILNTREARIMDLEPQVQMIMQEEELAMRLEELSGERLMPFEMLDAINEMRPPSIYFTRVATDGLRSFEAEARTPKSGDVDTFQRRLENADMLESVEIRGLRLRANDGQSSFNLAGTFREGALRKLSAATRNEEEAEEPAPAETEMEEPPAPEISDDRSPEERIPGRPPRPEMDLPGLPVREEEDYLEQPVVPLPHLSVGDVPVGEGAEDEIEREAGADPVPLPDLPVGDEPARAEESMEEEKK